MPCDRTAAAAATATKPGPAVEPCSEATVVQALLPEVTTEAAICRHFGKLVAKLVANSAAVDAQ